MQPSDTPPDPEKGWHLLTADGNVYRISRQAMIGVREDMMRHPDIYARPVEVNSLRVPAAFAWDPKEAASGEVLALARQAYDLKNECQFNDYSGTPRDLLGKTDEQVIAEGKEKARHLHAVEQAMRNDPEKVRRDAERARLGRLHLLAYIAELKRLDAAESEGSS